MMIFTNRFCFLRPKVDGLACRKQNLVQNAF